MRGLFFVLFCLLVTGTAFAADSESIAAKPTIIAQAPAGVCELGNNVAPIGSVTRDLHGGESFAAVFTAEQAPCGCPEGFNLESAFVLLGPLDGATFPLTIDLVATFHETVLDAGSGLVVPGAAICSSPVRSVTIESAGYYQISIPFDPAACACAYFGFDYAVAVEILTTFDPPLGIRHGDSFLTEISTFHDDGSGWTSVEDLGWTGNLPLWADAVCCDQTVPIESRSWSHLKSLYR